MSCVDKANAFVHWRRTISTDGITHTSGFVQALPKIKSGRSLTIYLAIATGDGLGVYGASANYIVLVDQTKFPSPDWKIVRPTHESQPNALQLEVKIREDEVAFRLKNNSGTTLRWNSCGFLVLCEDKPLFVRVTQVTSSDVTEIYEPSELVVPGLVTLQSQIDNLTVNLNALDADLTAEVNARIADVNSEEAARIAADATVQAFATNRANHTGTQLAATISDFASAARAQTEAELVAGSNITITPSGAGPTRQLTIASTALGGGAALPVWSPHKPPVAPNALDVEFASSSTISAWPAGWVPGAGGDFPNPLFPNTEPGRFSSWDGAGGWKGRIAACPAAGTDFNVAAFMAAHGVNSNFNLVGIGLSSNTTIGNSATAVLFFLGYHGTYGGYGIGVESSATLANWSSNHITQTGVACWIRRVGTSYFFGWSQDGLRGPEVTVASLPFVPAYMTIGMYSNHGDDSAAFIRWVRHISGNGARQLWGGLV